MKVIWKNMGVFLTVPLALAILPWGGACNRGAGSESGFEYAIKGFSAELTGVAQSGREAEGTRATDQAGKRLLIPARLGGKKVRSVAAGAFRGTDAVSVKVPRRVSKIGVGAFAGCTNLLWVELPSHLERVDEGLFQDCIRMEESDIPERVVAIGERAYSGCFRLRRVSFPENLKSVGPHAFSGCAKLESVELPEGISDIPEGAFEGCRGLKSVRIPAGVTNIGARAFAGCASLERIELPGAVRTVGDGAFAECAGLQVLEVAAENPVYSVRDGVLFRDGGKELVLFPPARGGAYAVPAGVERIGSGAFRGSRVETVEVPGDVGVVGADAFRDCRDLRQVALGDGVRELGDGAFAGCRSLWVFRMPDSVGKAGGDLFAGCDGLRLLVFPDALGREPPPPAAWQVPDGCFSCSRSAWEEERKGKRPGRAVGPFYGLYADEELETVVFEGTVLATSALPDPDRNGYDDCLYAILVELDSVLSTTPGSTNIERVVLVNVPVMEDRTLLQENAFAPGDQICCTCASYDGMPQGILEIQLSDDIQSFEHRQYYPLRIRRIPSFRENGNRDFAKREISILPVRHFPRDAGAVAARKARIQGELARIERELEEHGGSFEVWKEEYRPVAEEYARLCAEGFKGWIGDSYFAAGGPETTYDTKAYVEGLLPYKKYLEANNIDLVVLRIPSKWDFAARVLAADGFRENPAWVEHYYECLKNDIEIVDPMPEMWKERFGFPMFYFYNAPEEFHPFEGMSYIGAKVLAGVLERYPYRKSEREITATNTVFAAWQERFVWPTGNGKFDPADPIVFRQVFRDGQTIGNLLERSGSPFLFLSNSSFWYPQRPLGASIPGYTAFFLQTIPDWLYQDGASNPMIKCLFSYPHILDSRRAVILVGAPDGWKGFPPLPKYIQDGARRITLEKTLPAVSDEVAIHDPDSLLHSRNADSSALFVEDGTPTGEGPKRFGLEFEIPCMEGKRACMIRVNFAKTSYITVDLVEQENGSALDTCFLSPGREQSADFFVPLPNPSPSVRLLFRPRYPQKECCIKNIELWYY